MDGISDFYEGSQPFPVEAWAFRPMNSPSINCALVLDQAMPSSGIVILTPSTGQGSRVWRLATRDSPATPVTAVTFRCIRDVLPAAKRFTITVPIMNVSTIQPELETRAKIDRSQAVEPKGLRIQRFAILFAVGSVMCLGFYLDRKS